MAQTGYTPILIYSSSTASNAPAAGNLTNSTLGSELAINITDGKLFYKDNANTVQVIGWKTTPTTAGGTGLTSYTAGDLLYFATGTTLSKLAIGSSGQWLGSSGTAPQWNAPAALTKTDDTNVTLTLGGSASTALLNAASLTLGWTGQLSVARGGTGLSTLATNYIPYGNGTSAFQSSSNLTFDGTHLLVGTTSNTNNVTFKVYGSSEFGSANATYQFWYSGAVQIGTFGQGNYALTGGSSTGMGIWSNTYLSFGAGASNAEQWRMDNTGNLIPKVAAKGINFTANSAAAGMTSQLLNWYEEGTWTPTDQSGASLTFTGASGTYTRIGNQIKASFTLTYPSTASGVQNYISLPISSNGGGGMYVTYTNYGSAICGYVDGTNTRFVIADFSGNALTNANLSGKRIDGVVIYRAA